MLELEDVKFSYEIEGSARVDDSLQRPSPGPVLVVDFRFELAEYRQGMHLEDKKFEYRKSDPGSGPYGLILPENYNSQSSA